MTTLIAPADTDAEPLLAELARPDVVVDVTRHVPTAPCEHCQMVDATTAVTVDWIPRWDVLSDGTDQCCLDCAPAVIRRAVDDSQIAARVQVQIAAG